MATTSPVLAQSDGVILKPTSTSLQVVSTSERDRRVAELERAYDDVNLGPQKVGVSISSITFVGGLFMMGVGGGFNRWCPLSTETACPDRTGNALIGAGAAIAVSSLVGLVVSAVRLKKSRDKRGSLSHEIRRLGGGALPPEEIPAVALDLW